ncbi:hypothetical protein B5S50_01325 [Clostridium sp. 001]|nr:hypothetical protein B5S50_01325 [Clostridium sp. 001]
MRGSVTVGSHQIKILQHSGLDVLKYFCLEINPNLLKAHNGTKSQYDVKFCIKIGIVIIFKKNYHKDFVYIG